MPFLNRQTNALAPYEPVMQVPQPDAGAPPSVRAGKSRFFDACGNPHCKTGWLQIWRSRWSPVFEGKWNCSAACTLDRTRAAVRRELDGRLGAPEPHRHRVPIGLLMLEQGWITGRQLRGALEGQRTHGAGRLGHWLVMKEGVNEKLVTRAVALQWSCPVLSLEGHDAEALAPLLPRLFVDAYGAFPLKLAGDKLLYMAFEDRLDPQLTLAVERMTGLRVESGVVQSSQFRSAHQYFLGAPYPGVELVEASSEPALVRVLARRIEKSRPVEARLVRVHDCLWLRLWSRAQTGPVPGAADVQDVLCTIAVP